jgi:hypothetical protein
MPVMHKTWLLLLPELRSFPAREHARALEAARETPLDIVELVGTAFAVVIVTALARHGLADPGLASHLAGAALNLAVALPLLILAAGPFQVRRLRRGLRRQLELRAHHE